MSDPEQKDLEKIIKSAQRLGVEIDEGDALQWLAAASAQSQSGIEMDERSGVFGHSISLLDFDDTDRANAARAEIINIVNNFFYEKLTGITSISQYIENIQK